MSKSTRITLSAQQQSEYQRYLEKLARAQLREMIPAFAKASASAKAAADKPTSAKASAEKR